MLSDSQAYATSRSQFVSKQFHTHVDLTKGEIATRCPPRSYWSRIDDFVSRATCETAQLQVRANHF